MANEPSAPTVYNNAASMHLDSRTPGLNAFIEAWAALQDFTGNWAVGNYNQLVVTSGMIGEFAT